MPVYIPTTLASTTSRAPGRTEEVPVDPIGAPVDDRFVVSMEGLAMAVPPAWEARISRSTTGGDETGTSYPVVHAATIPLPSQRGDYGSNVVERLKSEDVFVSLVEFGPEAVDTPLFPRFSDIPRSIGADDFHPRQLQRVLPGQAGKQVFFTFADRAFCLYIVLGSYARRAALASRVEDLLARLDISPKEG